MRNGPIQYAFTYTVFLEQSSRMLLANYIHNYNMNCIMMQHENSLCTLHKNCIQSEAGSEYFNQSGINPPAAHTSIIIMRSVKVRRVRASILNEQ